MGERRLLTRRGLAVLAASLVCFVAAIALTAPVLAHVTLFFALLLGMGTLVVYMPDARGEVARVVSTDLIAVGEWADVEVRLRVRGRLIRRARWNDTLPAALRGEAEGFVAAEDDTADTRVPLTVRYRVRGIRRGVWSLGPLRVRTSDPFGLVNRRQRVGASRIVTVVPALVPVPELGTLPGAVGGTAQTASQRIGPGVDNLAPRRYFPGDSTRRIHWRATAHRGDLMVRQEDEETSPDALVVLDLSPVRWAARSAHADPLFERAVSVTASAALHLAETGYLVDVIDSAGVLLGSLRGHEDDTDALLVALASVNPRRPDAVAHIEAAPHGPVVVVTGRIADIAADLPRHPGGAALLLAADPEPAALESLRAQGWHAARLDEGGPDA